MDSTNHKSTKKLAIQNNVSQIKFDECEKILREHYKIPDSVCLKFSKIDYDPQLNIDTESKKLNNSADQISIKENGISVAVDIYNCDNNQKLDKSLCNKISTTSSVPLPKNSTRGNKIKKSTKELSKCKINYGKNSGKSSRFLIDITNQGDPIFNNRCIKLSNNNGQSLTVNERRKAFYPNTTVSCVVQTLDTNSKTNKTKNSSNDSQVCVHTGLDENNYSVCDCIGVQETKNIFEVALLESISEVNIGIVV